MPSKSRRMGSGPNGGSIILARSSATFGEWPGSTGLAVMSGGLVFSSAAALTQGVLGS